MKILSFTCCLIASLLFGCHVGKQNQEVLSISKLEKSPTNIEYIQAEVGYVTPLFKAKKISNFSYELNLINNSNGQPPDLSRIEVCDVEHPEKTFLILEGDKLKESISSPGVSNNTDPRRLKTSQLNVVNIVVEFDEELEIPKAIFHRLIFEYYIPDFIKKEVRIETAIAILDKSEPLVLGLPFQKGLWFYMADSHANTRFLTRGNPSYAQRFAIDFAYLENDGTFVKGDVSKNENYPTYNLNVLAVADGVVKAILDSIPENIPESGKLAVKISRETIGGNYIILDIGNNVNAVYAHFIPGSFKVKVGDKVKKGAVLGSIGNSGNSDGPHLHFHLETDSPMILGGEGLPFYFEKFKRIKAYPLDEIGELFLGEKLDLSNPINSIETNAFPTGNGVLEF